MISTRTAAFGAAALVATGAFLVVDRPSGPVDLVRAAAESSSSGEGRPGGERLRRRLERRLCNDNVAHADLTVRNRDDDGEPTDGWHVVSVDRGTVASISDTSLAVSRPDGVRVAVTIDDDTKYGRDGDRPAQGARVLVASQSSVAKRVVTVPAEACSGGSDADGISAALGV